MNFSEIIDLTNSYVKEQAVLRKEEAQQFYDKSIILNLLMCLAGYLVLIYACSQIKNVSLSFSGINLIIVLGTSFYLGASLYYLMTLVHDYVHASQYYSAKSSFLMEYIVPIFLPINPSGYRWGHFHHHLNTNRFLEEYDTLPPLKLEKTLTALCFNSVAHSLLLTQVFIVRIAINPLMMLSKPKQLVYFNYISPVGRISPRVYSLRENAKEFRRNWQGNLITLISVLTLWACSGFSLIFWEIYLLSIFVFSAWLAFRSLVDHACIDVQGKDEVMKANFYFTSNFPSSYFWYAGFATYHLIHHINPSIPHYFCQEINDLLCETFPDYKKLHQKRSNFTRVIRDFFSKEVTEADLLKC